MCGGREGGREGCHRHSLTTSNLQFLKKIAVLLFQTRSEMDKTVLKKKKNIALYTWPGVSCYLLKQEDIVAATRTFS